MCGRLPGCKQFFGPGSCGQRSRVSGLSVRHRRRGPVWRYASISGPSGPPARPGFPDLSLPPSGLGTFRRATLPAEDSAIRRTATATRLLRVTRQHPRKPRVVHRRPRVPDHRWRRPEAPQVPLAHLRRSMLRGPPAEAEKSRRRRKRGDQSLKHGRHRHRPHRLFVLPDGGVQLLVAPRSCDRSSCDLLQARRSRKPSSPGPIARVQPADMNRRERNSARSPERVDRPCDQKIANPELHRPPAGSSPPRSASGAVPPRRSPPRRIVLLTLHESASHRRGSGIRRTS